MKHWDYRKEAKEIIENARAMNATSEHTVSMKQAQLAEMIVELANEIDILKSGAIPVEQEAPVIVPMRSASVGR